MQIRMIVVNEKLIDSLYESFHKSLEERLFISALISMTHERFIGVLDESEIRYFTLRN